MNKKLSPLLEVLKVKSGMKAHQQKCQQQSGVLLLKYYKSSTKVLLTF